MKITPLGSSALQPQAWETRTHVTPPTPIAYTMARGASSDGRGISSVMCAAASKPINDRADCRRPRIHAIPSTQPVELEKLVNTNLALFLDDVANSVMLMTTTARMDQYTEPR